MIFSERPFRQYRFSRVKMDIILTVNITLNSRYRNPGVSCHKVSQKINGPVFPGPL